MAARTIHNSGVELATESFGKPSDPPVLLIMGVMASMLWWPAGFCEKLADTGRFVIRYDHRDTGLSTAYEPGTPDYSFGDMVDDAMRVLDGYEVETAHIVGMSMGGMIAQRVALKYPDRVRSTTLISTSPVGIDTGHLPGMTASYAEHSARGETVDWTQRDQVIDFIVAEAAALAGNLHPHDAEAARAFIERDYDRARRFQSATNHFLLMGGDQPEGGVSDLTMPVLVIHGTADPIFPIEHGEALADAVAGARLERVEGGGHELHEQDWVQIIEAIRSLTAGSSRAVT